MYCPNCLNETLIFNKKGIIHIIINKKQMDNGRFLYNLDEETDDEIFIKLREKIEEFFKWYSRFLNKESIQYLELASNSFTCLNNCKIDPNYKQSVIDLIIPKEKIAALIKELAPKYDLNVELK